MSADRPDLPPCPHLSSRRTDHVAACLDLSHELRTPANAILGHLELILDGSAGPLSSELRTSLGEIQRAALILSKRIGDVINLAESIPHTPPTKPGQEA